MPARMPIVLRVYHIMFGRMLRQHLRRPPRTMIKQPYELHEITDDDTRIFSTVHARSPANVRSLMRRHHAANADELMPHLKDNHYHVDPRQRLIEWGMRVFGERPYDTTVSGVVTQLKRQRRMPPDNVLGTSRKSKP